MFWLRRIVSTLRITDTTLHSFAAVMDDWTKFIPSNETSENYDDDLELDSDNNDLPAEGTFGCMLNSTSMKDDQREARKFAFKMNNRLKIVNSKSKKSSESNTSKPKPNSKNKGTKTNKKSGRMAPTESKIYKTPPRFYGKPSKIGVNTKKYGSNNDRDETTDEITDPRYRKSIATMNYNHNTHNRNKNGWELRKAYSFLDDLIEKDIEKTKKELDNCKKDRKYFIQLCKDNDNAAASASKTSKNKNNRIRNNNNDNGFVSQLGNEINEQINELSTNEDRLKVRLKQLTNRLNMIKERDLKQATKSQLRKQDLELVKQGKKRAFFYKESHINPNKAKHRMANSSKEMKSRNSSVFSDHKERRVSIQEAYNKNKYEQLKKSGKIDKYIKRRRKRVNSKAKAAFKKKSGRGWRDSDEL